jgi:uncharacterized protein YndB with AHSA1/START domain
MSNNLLFDFTVDKPTKMVYITREFDADINLVWDAFTKAEFLDQWVAPKPLTAKTKYMDFKVGGKRFYAMILPDGQERWALQQYKSITPKTNFKLFNVFTDAAEKPEQYGSDWDYTFSEQDGRTKVNITIYNESLERLEMILDGFTKGMTASLINLDELLASMSKK